MTDALAWAPSGVLTAIVPCNDLDRSEAFYNRLGFSRPDEDRPADPVDDGYRLLRNADGGGLHLTGAEDGWLVNGRNPFGLYLYSSDPDAIAARVDELIIRPGGRLRHREWGMYEFGLSDPDGTLVRVGWPSRLIRARENGA